MYFRSVMMIEIMKSKLHHCAVTQAELHYVGSITIEEDLMNEAKAFKPTVLILDNNKPTS